MGGYVFVVAIFLVVAASSPLAADVPGDPAVLTDLNTTIEVYSNSDAGIASWLINGVNQINREWFWFRVGDASPTNPEQSIDTLLRTLNNTSDDGENPGYDTLSQKFVSEGQFSVLVKYTLAGGDVGTGDSDLGLAVKIVNLSQQTLDFHFFQLIDFDLAGTPGGDIVQVINANFVKQVQSNHQASTVIVPASTIIQLAYSPAIYNLLSDSQGDDLTNTPVGGSVGPGNVEYGFQWDITLAPGANFMFSENQLLVPEPASLSLLLIGAAFMARRRRNA